MSDGPQYSYAACELISAHISTKYQGKLFKPNISSYSHTLTTKPKAQPSCSAHQRITTGGLIVGRNGVVDVDHEARVGGRVGAREGQQTRAGRAGAAGDADLGARDVQLGAAGRAGRVQADVLEAHEVLAVGDAAGDGDLHGGDAWGSWWLVFCLS